MGYGLIINVVTPINGQKNAWGNWGYFTPMPMPINGPGCNFKYLPNLEDGFFVGN